MTQLEFTRLYNQWHNSRCRSETMAKIRRSGGDDDDASECFHLALTKFLQKTEAGEQFTNPDGWLYRCAWREFLHRRRGGDTEMPPATDLPIEPSGSPAGSSTNPAIEEIIDQPTATALAKLSEGYRTLLHLTIDPYPPLTDEEIAAQCGLTLGAMRVKRSEARDAFRTALTQLGYAYLLPPRRTRRDAGKKS